jgi:ubiquinone/menaquinone biosynthesis C-methylase UbiE
MREVPFFGELYRRTTEPFLSDELSRAEARFIADMLEIRTGSRVLDVGCGSGRHMAKLGPSGAKLWGVDADQTALASSRRHAQVAAGDLRALPFRSKVFPLAYCWYTTLFVFDASGNRQALAEVARVLAPRARFLMQTLNPDRLAEKPTATFEHTLPDGSIVRESSRFDPARGEDVGTRTLTPRSGEPMQASYRLCYHRADELQALFHAAGLSVVRLFGGITGEDFRRQATDLIVLAERR